ncbi:MAG: hypothetical protein SO101_00695 [Lachnospiraceae bacterium]|nr:hypothetical protein [Lachnospiraceae bacterium]
MEKQDEIVKHLQLEKKQAEELIYSVGSPGTEGKVQTSASADQTLKQIIDLEKKREELAAACNAYMDFRIKVTEQIHQLPNETQRRVLYEHYMKFESLHEIAKKLHFDYSYVASLRRKGITEFFRLHKKTIETIMKDHK